MISEVEERQGSDMTTLLSSKLSSSNVAQAGLMTQKCHVCCRK
jgi:hypothetical protein